MKPWHWSTPRGLLLRAVLAVLIFAACHALGWREYTTLLSGTAYAGSWARCQALCAVYLVSYFMALLGAPILLLAAGLLAGWERLGRKP